MVDLYDMVMASNGENCSLTGWVAFSAGVFRVRNVQHLVEAQLNDFSENSVYVPWVRSAFRLVKIY